MDWEKQVDYWVVSAGRDLDTAEVLIEGKKYDWALFMGHLVLEKLLKALFVKRKKAFPEKTHNLIRLSHLSDIELSADDRIFFEQVNSFHISSRYPDDQFKFFEICNESFSRNNFKKIKEKCEWLKEELKH